MSASRTDATVAGELIWAPTGDLRENSWNPNRMDDFMFDRELASVDKFGMVDPITTRSLSDGLYEIIDGEHRWKAAVKLDMAEVPIWNLGTIPDHIAKQLTLALNEIKGTHERDEVATILRDLLASEPTQELLRLLPYSQEAFNELLNLPALDWEDFDRHNPRTKDDEERWVERVFRMPLGAAAVLDKAIAKTGEEQDWKALEYICADYLGGPSHA